MPYFRVAKKMMYTELVYVEAEDAKQAENRSGLIEGEVVTDDHWHESNCEEVTKEDYEMNAG